ncbi:MAG: Uma2 family endonuclease [Myxococcaceae bacterium]|nr:Uma2 family endonuclease [Myxococcaceae bacterium]
MSTARQLHHSYEDYLRMLAVSDLKLEYCEGTVYAMAGGTPTHAALAASAIRLLGQSLLGRCLVYSSDLMVRIDSLDQSTYPDASVVCGPVVPSPVDRNACTNPSILVEVTSKGTEDYDRGEKLSAYKQLSSLQAVLLISHRSRRVTSVTRTPTGWAALEVIGGEHVVLETPSVRFAIDDLYADVTLE